MEDADRVGQVFAAVDAMDTEAFLGFLDEDAQFRFGSAPAVTGKEAIRETVNGFFTSIRGLSHEILQTWSQGETVICQGQVTYTRTDESCVTLPFVNIWRMRNSRIREYLIYIDIGPLFSAAC